MGRIRNGFVKRVSEEILAAHRKKFTADFDQNKPAVQDSTDVSTKKLRNLIAGYITKKVKTNKEISL